MNPKLKVFCTAAVFLIVNCVSGINYGFYVGRWKAYIAVFGIVELALVTVAFVVATVRWAVHFLRRSGKAIPDRLSILAAFPYILLSLMHIFLAIFAMGGAGGRNAIWYLLYHVGCILLGWYVIKASIKHLGLCLHE